MPSEKISDADFVHLHLHTGYSISDSTIKIDEVMKQAAAYHMPAIAITDHMNMFGAVEFYKKAIKAGIKPIIGCEVIVKNGDMVGGETAFHLILLAKDSTGYKNLTTLISKSYLEGSFDNPMIDRTLLDQYRSGLIGLSSCLNGEVPYHLRYNQMEKAYDAAIFYRDVLGVEDFFLEIQNSGLREQHNVNKSMIKMSRELNIPLVATNNCHYLRREDAKVHSILNRIRKGKPITYNESKLLIDEFYFKSPAEMKSAFSEVPEAILNTRLIAEKCNFNFNFEKMLLPKYELPNGVSPDVYIEELSIEGLKAKHKGNPPAQYIDRLKSEIRIIKQTGLVSYFLVAWDFIKYARENGIPIGPGRGPSVGSLVAYCLNVTEIDPLKYHLIFERFLNPDLADMPHMEFDFCMNRRREVIDYVCRKYGSDRVVTQSNMYGTYYLRSAVRACSKIMDIQMKDVNKIVELMPNGHMKHDNSWKFEPQLKELCDTNPTARELIDIAERLEGLISSTGGSPVNIVISPLPLTDLMPLYKISEATVITQFGMDAIRSIGLSRVCFLGLNDITVLKNTVDYLKQQGMEIILSGIPRTDAATYSLLCSGETTGIFQLEGVGMRRILVKMQPHKFEDIIALLALYRLGPLQSGITEDFIKRKNRDIEIGYELPQLKDILDETCGIILFQEQIMTIANKIAGFSMGQADLFRRALEKKYPEDIRKQKEVFINGAIVNGISEKKAVQLFERMAYVAEHTANKSHLAAYALIVYQAAYMKCHHPAEFMRAIDEQNYYWQKKV